MEDEEDDPGDGDDESRDGSAIALLLACVICGIAVWIMLFLWLF